MNYSVDELYNIIGKNIKRIRKKNKDSQEALAEKLNMSRGFISQIESEKIKIGISIETLYKIAKIYNVKMNEFFKEKIDA